MKERALVEQRVQRIPQIDQAQAPTLSYSHPEHLGRSPLDPRFSQSPLSPLSLHISIQLPLAPPLVLAEIQVLAKPVIRQVQAPKREIPPHSVPIQSPFPHPRQG